MYFEEKLINGILHWRGNPDSEFIPYDLEELSRSVVEMKSALKIYNERMHRCIAIMNGEDTA